jgi:tetratricopeptide (TPR) repeat protein
MKKTLFLYYILFLTSLFSVEIEMREGREGDNKFSTLNLRSPEAISCEKTLNEFEQIAIVQCQFSKVYGKELESFSNSFFDIKVEEDGKETTLKIEPRYNSILFSSDQDIVKLKVFTPRKEIEQAKHWVMVGYKTPKPPFIEGKNLYNPKTINFPIDLKFHKMPFIGALDINGQPIPEGSSEDVELYMKLREEYKEGSYRRVLDLSNELLKNYPHTLFKSEIVLHQIRALFKLHAYNKIINISKDFLRNFSSDVAVPEVLLYAGYVHSKLGLLSQAKYYFERLFEEHKDSEYRNMGFVYYGDDRIQVGKERMGLRLYKQALYNTKDRLIATKASYRLGNRYLKDLKGAEADKYFSKIVQGNPQYYNLSVDKSYKIANELAHFKRFDVASDIMRILLDGKDYRNLDKYEVMLKDFALWLDYAGKVEESFNEYSRYIEYYNYGSFDTLVRENRDRLLFRRDETNQTKVFANFNKLVKRYGLPSEIGKQAIYEKGLLLHDTGEYQMVLDIENQMRVAEKTYPDVDRVIKSSATHVSTANLRAGKCEASIELINQYDLNLSKDDDLKLYECSIKAGKYPLGEEISKRKIETGSNTLDWTYRYSQVLYKTGRYEEFLEVSDEVLELMKADRSDKYLDIYYDRFQAYDILRLEDEVLETADKLQKIFKDTYRNLQPFKRAVAIGKKRRDLFLIEKYGYKVIEIQEKLASFVESPDIEFLLITSLKEQDKVEETVDVAQRLINRKASLQKDEVARGYYELGIALQSLNRIEEAKESFKNSKDASPNNVWGRLSSDYLELYEKPKE